MTVRSRLWVLLGSASAFSACETSDYPRYGAEAEADGGSQSAETDAEVTPDEGEDASSDDASGPIDAGLVIPPAREAEYRCGAATPGAGLVLATGGEVSAAWLSDKSLLTTSAQGDAAAPVHGFTLWSRVGLTQLARQENERVLDANDSAFLSVESVEVPPATAEEAAQAGSVLRVRARADGQLLGSVAAILRLKEAHLASDGSFGWALTEATTEQPAEVIAFASDGTVWARRSAVAAVGVGQGADAALLIADGAPLRVRRISRAGAESPALSNVAGTFVRFVGNAGWFVASSPDLVLVYDADGMQRLRFQGSVDERLVARSAGQRFWYLEPDSGSLLEFDTSQGVDALGKPVAQVLTDFVETSEGLLTNTAHIRLVAEGAQVEHLPATESTKLSALGSAWVAPGITGDAGSATRYGCGSVESVSMSELGALLIGTSEGGTFVFGPDGADLLAYTTKTDAVTRLSASGEQAQFGADIYDLVPKPVLAHPIFGGAFDPAGARPLSADLSRFSQSRETEDVCDVLDTVTGKVAYSYACPQASPFADALSPGGTNAATIGDAVVRMYTDAVFSGSAALGEAYGDETPALRFVDETHVMLLGQLADASAPQASTVSVSGVLTPLTCVGSVAPYGSPVLAARALTADSYFVSSLDGTGSTATTHAAVCRAETSATVLPTVIAIAGELPRDVHEELGAYVLPGTGVVQLAAWR